MLQISFCDSLLIISWITTPYICGIDFFYYSIPHYMVILHALLNLVISFTFALNNKLYWMYLYL
jgi:hypothetical protein